MDTFAHIDRACTIAASRTLRNRSRGLQRVLGKDTAILRNPRAQGPLSDREGWEVCESSDLRVAMMMAPRTRPIVAVTIEKPGTNAGSATSFPKLSWSVEVLLPVSGGQEQSTGFLLVPSQHKSVGHITWSVVVVFSSDWSSVPLVESTGQP